MQFRAPYSVIPTGNLALRFHPEHLADLRASGLNDDTIKAAGVYSIRPSDIARFFNPSRGVPDEIESALCFPYPPHNDFARIKLFPPLGKMKYSQPPGTGARLYMPFPIGGGPLCVVEGEKKTLAAHQSGLNAVGIGGLWNWLSHGQAIEDLRSIDWEDREVTIYPDSDVFNRQDLRRAVYALGRELQSHGASIYIAKIPQATGAKIGLDDFVVGGGIVDDLEVVTLGGRDFRSAASWHGQWKTKTALSREVGGI